MIKAILNFSIVVVLTSSAEVHAQEQQLPDSVRLRIIELLDNSPLLEPTLSIVLGARYVRDTRMLLSIIDTTLVLPEQTALEATRELERRLERWLERTGGESPMATVESVPDGLVVTYRPITDPEAQELTATTRDEFPLRPALYVFRCTNPTTGQVVTQRKSCATNCRVVFNFGG